MGLGTVQDEGWEGLGVGEGIGLGKGNSFSKMQGLTMPDYFHLRNNVPHPAKSIIRFGELLTNL